MSQDVYKRSLSLNIHSGAFLKKKEFASYKAALTFAFIIGEKTCQLESLTLNTAAF